jgi:hypothetical protein
MLLANSKSQRATFSALVTPGMMSFRFQWSSLSSKKFLNGL